jgi:Protein of unknown function (DUF3617)
MRKLVCLMLFAICTPVLGQEMEPGEWEFVSTMTSPGMPKPHTMTHARCVTKDDMDPSRWADRQQGKSDCKVTGSKKSAGTQSWEVSCPKSGMRGSGSARYTRSTVEAELRLTGEGGGKQFEMLTKTTGKRLGACKK